MLKSKAIIIQCNKQSGFTLIEIIAVFALLAVLASISVPKFINLGSTASQRALQAALSELNAQESMVWSRVKLSETGWVDDETLFLEIDTELGTGYKWTPRVEIDGGNLHFKDQMLKLKRSPSTSVSVGKWEQI